MKRGVLLWAIVAAGAGLRLPSLLHDGLWADDAFVYVNATAPTLADFFHRIVQSEYHPPLFLLLEYAYVRVVPAGEIALGLLPCAFSLATIPLVYLLGRDADGEETGLVAAAMFAAAPLTVAYADEYLYPFAGFFFTLLAWLVLRARRAPRAAPWIVAIAATTAVCFYAHYTALIFVPVLLLWLAFSPGDRARRIGIGAAVAIGAMPFAFWLPVFLRQHRIGLPWELTTTALNRASFFLVTIVRYVPAWPIALQLTVFAPLCAGIFFAVRRRRIASDVGGPAACFFVTLLVMSVDNELAERYVLPQCAFLFVLFASLLVGGIARMRAAGTTLSRAALAGTFVLALAALGGDVAFAFTNANSPKSGIRTFVAERGLDPQTLYVVSPDYMASVLKYYSRSTPLAVRGFVRYDDPELLRLDGYQADWNHGDAVRETMRRIEEDTADKRCLAYVVESTMQQRGSMPYARAWDLLRALRSRYALAGERSYAGRWEAVTVFGFSTSPAGSRGAAAGRCAP